MAILRFKGVNFKVLQVLVMAYYGFVIAFYNPTIVLWFKKESYILNKVIALLISFINGFKKQCDWVLLQILFTEVRNEIKIIL